MARSAKEFKLAAQPPTSILTIPTILTILNLLTRAVEAGDLKTIEGVERFRAAADLDVGDFAVRAKDLAVRAGEGEAGRVVFLDDKGALRRDGDLVFEAPAGGKRGKLSVGRLEVAGAVDGPLVKVLPLPVWP